MDKLREHGKWLVAAIAGFFGGTFVPDEVGYCVSHQFPVEECIATGTIDQPLEIQSADRPTLWVTLQ